MLYFKMLFVFAGFFVLVSVMKTLLSQQISGFNMIAPVPGKLAEGKRQTDHNIAFRGDNMLHLKF